MTYSDFEKELAQVQVDHLSKGIATCRKYLSAHFRNNKISRQAFDKMSKEFDDLEVRFDEYLDEVIGDER